MWMQNGCPLVDIAVGIAKEYKLEIIVVKLCPWKLPTFTQLLFLQIFHVIVLIFYIINRIEKGDIVIT